MLPNSLSVFYLYVGRLPLHKVLHSATSLGPDTVLKRECDVFLFKAVRWHSPQDHVYYLDSATGIPLKVESFADENARSANHPLWTWTADSIDRVDDHYITLNSTMVDYDGKFQPSTKWINHTVSVSFNKEYPSSTFSPRLEPGVFVIDEIKGKSYAIPGVVKNPIEPAPTSLPPVEAVPPSDWTSSLSGIVIAMGLIVLVIGGILWKRER